MIAGGSASFVIFKIQSLDNQTSKFTHPLGNVAPQVIEGKQSQQRVLTFCLLQLKIRMNDKKSIKEFLSDIDCDLLQYAGELRKKGFLNIEDL